VKRLAQQHGVHLLQPERLRDESFLGALQGLKADIGVVAAYGKILPEAVLQAPRHGLINVHASLLPKYRGAAPIHRSIVAGESETGVTIMRVVQALDAGPMLLSVRTPIGPDETSIEVESRLARLGAEALGSSLAMIAGGPVPGVPQDDAQSTYAHRLVKSDGIVDWSASAIAIHNQIRGLHPWPHAYADLEGDRTILLRSRVDPNRQSRADAPNGTIVDVAGDSIDVQTGAGVLSLLELQREGRRPVRAASLISGLRLGTGARFTRSQPRT
jgi:methionyl-tRNA formyltransferase